MKILILSTYPIDTPCHGGQLRVSNIVETYRKAGHDVAVNGVLSSRGYPESTGFISMPDQNLINEYVNDCPGLEDFAAGEICANEKEYYEKLKQIITIKPDVIELEHPYLFRFAHKFVNQELKPPTTIVYSSHNVEYEMKKKILMNYYHYDETDQIISRLEELEIETLNGSDCIVCVSENDVKWVKNHSGKPVLLAPNGVKEWEVLLGDTERVKQITCNEKFALFCASGHPPNLTGFFNMFYGGFGALNTGQKLIVVGGVGGMILNDERLTKSARLNRHLQVLGVIDKGLLNGLLNDAHCIVLPITEGGGTNLKTAEALWAGKHIVATTIAMRGFEKFINSTGVHIADTAADFKRALRLAMESAPVALTEGERNRRRSVLWESCLSDMPNFVSKIYKFKREAIL